MDNIPKAKENYLCWIEVCFGMEIDFVLDIDSPWIVNGYFPVQ
jgi:hypothetical protein